MTPIPGAYTVLGRMKRDRGRPTQLTSFYWAACSGVFLSTIGGIHKTSSHDRDARFGSILNYKR